MTLAEKLVWLDCDPGHDDAIAILLAIYLPGIKLVGVSTVHGNTDPENTFKNAHRCLYAFGAPGEIGVHKGATQPLLRKAKHDPEIHGIDGLGGVEGLPDAVTLKASRPKIDENVPQMTAIEAMRDAVIHAQKDDRKVVIVSTGPMTNIALFISAYRHLLAGVEEFVFMGGGVGQGNRSAVAEYNILCDPEAAQIVFNVDIKKTMIPINVTHTAILTRSTHCQLLDPSQASVQTSPSSSLPTAQTPLRHTLSTLVTFFASTYESTFGFKDGPPLHDALTLAYVAHPELFKCIRRHVDIELKGEHTAGETVVDVFGYKDNDESWGMDGLNCLVCHECDVDNFWKVFLECVERCDKVSPLNKAG